MSTIYYIAVGGRQEGPFSFEQLKGRNLSRDTLVWCPGMEGWAEASSLPELEPLFAEVPPRMEHLGDNARWFAMINGTQVGPYTFETLRSMGLHADTPVWRNGMADWVEVRYLPELMSKLTRPAAPAEPVANLGMNGVGNAVPSRQTRTNWKTLAIIATVAGFLFSCIGLIFGVIGIVNADKADKMRALGQIEAALQAESTARTMTVIAFVLAGLGLLLSIVVFSLSAGLMGVGFVGNLDSLYDI